MREHLFVYPRPRASFAPVGTRRRPRQAVLLPVVARRASCGNLARVRTEPRRPGANRWSSSYAAALAPGPGRARLIGLTALRPELPAPLFPAIPSSWQRVSVSVGDEYPACFARPVMYAIYPNAGLGFTNPHPLRDGRLQLRKMKICEFLFMNRFEV